MALAQLVVASIAYAVGGLFMKLSEGLSRPWPTIAFSVLFLGGAMLQALGMRGSDLGVSFVFVLGVEAIGATALSTLYLHERKLPASRGPARRRRRRVAAAYVK